MKKILILISCILLLGITGCTKQKEVVTKEEKPTLADVISSGNYIIVDVRTQSEYETSHVKDAINIPYDEIDENTDLPKDKVILVYCRSGARSEKAYETLTSLGYESINLGSYDSLSFEKE